MTVERFVPSAVSGVSGVKDVAVFPDRLELVTEAGAVVVRFFDIARWPRPAWLWRGLFRMGWGPKWLPIADRDWCLPATERYFAFYGDPRVVVKLPEDPEQEYGRSLFRRVQDVIVSGGFHTVDGA